LVVRSNRTRPTIFKTALVNTNAVFLFKRAGLLSGKNVSFL
jgi:hypothetical protein